MIAVPVSWQEGSTPPAAMRRVAQKLEGDEPVVVRRLGIIEDRPQLREVARPEEVRDVAHRLGREEGQQRRVDLEEPATGRLDRAHPVGRHEPIRGVVVPARREHVLVLEVAGHRVERYRRRVPRMTTTYRTEHDSMGEVRVPTDAWGAQTQRAVENFPISGRPIERALIGALATIKGVAATVNAELRVIPKDMASAIHDAAAEVATGAHDDHFPIDVFQTGSGTSSNMNMNEVIARLASESLGRPVHPNDHVNASQSSNDVFPSAIHLATPRARSRDLIPALEHLAKALRRKQRRFKTVVKAGRTHLMDATPVTLGQEFGGYAQARSSTASSGSRRRCPASASCPSAAPRSAPASTAREAFAQRVIAKLADRHAAATHRGPRPLRGPGRARRARRGVAASAA